jgi:hypothetical protein
VRRAGLATRCPPHSRSWFGQEPAHSRVDVAFATSTTLVRLLGQSAGCWCWVLVLGCLLTRGVSYRWPGVFSEFSGGGKRHAYLLQKGPCGAGVPLHGLRPLRIGLPAPLPQRDGRMQRFGSARRVYERRSLRFRLPGKRHTDEVGAPEWRPRHRMMAVTHFESGAAPTERSPNLRLQKLSRGLHACPWWSTHPAIGKLSPRFFRYSTKGQRHSHSARVRC